jgi:Mrp family chromosome partitioning ATPase
MTPQVTTKLPFKKSDAAAPAAPDDSREREGRKSELIGADAAQQQMAALLAMVLKLIDERGSAIIHLASARPGEGTSTIAREIAGMAALSKWCKVALIDAARPSRAGAVPVSIVGAANLEAIELDLHQMRFGESEVAVGELNKAGEFALRVDAVRRHYAWLRANYSLIIVDCPPVLVSVEATTIAALADGTILVVEAERSRVPDLERARELLLQAGGAIFGVVLNKRPKLPDFIARMT